MEYNNNKPKDKKKYDFKSDFRNKHTNYNLINPVFISEADVQLAPRMYRTFASNKKDNEWLIKILRDRKVFTANPLTMNFPVFSNTTPESVLVVFRFVGIGANFRSINAMHKIFLDIYSTLPPKNDELFYKANNVHRSFNEDLFKTMKDLEISPVGITEEGTMPESGSVKIRMSFKNISMIDLFLRDACKRFQNTTYSLETLIKEYKQNGYPNSDVRILQADEILLCPDSFTTDKLVVRGRDNKASDEAPKGMPVRISYKDGYVTFETIDSNILDQMKNLCDNRIKNCVVCPKQFCMERGTVCSWHVRRAKQKERFVCRIIFPKEGFFNVMAKMLYFSSGEAPK